MKEEEIRVIKLFKILGNPTRYRIVKMLAERNISSCELSKILRKSESSISQHLSKLKNLDIVKYHMETKNVIYELKKNELFEFLRNFEDYYLREFEK